MIVVSDTSAISALLQTRLEHILERLYGTVLIPRAVHRELLAGHNELPSFLVCDSIANQAEVERLSCLLDRGEAEAIVLAREKRADLLLIDERSGRELALREGVPIIGLLGVLLQAKRNNILISVRSAVAQLEQVAGFYLSRDVKDLVFRHAQE